MAVICFVSFEIHPTTAGGCGVLIHHAADVLLSRDHEVVLLLDIPDPEFRKFVEVDRLGFARPARLRAYRVGALCKDFPYQARDIPCVFQRNSLRFAHALSRLQELELIDFVEFFEYCGPGYYSLMQRLFQPRSQEGRRHAPVLGVRVHGSMEVLDRFGDGCFLERDRLILHALEHQSISLADTVLVPTRTYYERYYRTLYGLESERVVVSQPPKVPLPRVRIQPPEGRRASIVFVGRLSHLKGVDQLVHAAVALFRRRPDLDCTVELIGADTSETPFGTSYGDYLRTLIPPSLRDRFVFLDHLSHDAISSRLAGALFAVFPNRVESFCYALHEVYDAGVPVIINELPAFADFFQHEQNALLYDGSVRGLFAAMERMADDPTLRERLRRPYPVAERPLGDFYDHLSARESPAVPGSAPRALVVVLCDDERVTATPAATALARQTAGGFRVVHLVPANLGQAQPEDEAVLWLLGRPWYPHGADGGRLPDSEAATLDALLLLRSGDRLAPAWMEGCLSALSSRERMAFAGTWLRTGGTILPLPLDLVPELHPFERGSALTRVLMRTDPGVPLAELFDPSLGPLGEIGYLWSAISQRGPGAIFPAPLCDAVEDEPGIDPQLLKSLVIRYGSPHAGRLALLAGLLHEQLAWRHDGDVTRALSVPELAQELRLNVADTLGGRTLARLALRRLARRMWHLGTR